MLSTSYRGPEFSPQCSQLPLTTALGALMPLASTGTHKHVHTTYTHIQFKNKIFKNINLKTVTPEFIILSLSTPLLNLSPQGWGVAQW